MSLSLGALGITSVTNLLGTLAEKIWPDPNERAKRQAELFELQQKGDFKQIDAMLAAASGQTDINKQEAGSNFLFVAGWRPFVGWVCGSALAYNYILQPLLQFGIVASGVELNIASLPILNSGELMTVLLGMLGLGGLRTYEKTLGVASHAKPANDKTNV